MLKINVADVVKVLTVDSYGTCDDGTERTWCRCSALSFFDKDETYMNIVCFGPTADMVLDNHSGENMRRAFISGTMEIKTIKVPQKIKVLGEKKTIMVDSTSFTIIADTFNFIDKNRLNDEVEEDDEEEVLTEYTTVEDAEDDEEYTPAETAATKTKSSTFKDADEVVVGKKAGSKKNARAVADKKERKKPVRK